MRRWSARVHQAAFGLPRQVGGIQQDRERNIPWWIEGREQENRQKGREGSWGRESEESEEVDDSRQGRLDSRLGGGRRRQSSFKGKGSRKTLEAWPLAALWPEGKAVAARNVTPPHRLVRVLDSVAASRPSSTSRQGCDGLDLWICARPPCSVRIRARLSRRRPCWSETAVDWLILICPTALWG